MEVRQVMREIYISSDGIEFDNKNECLSHEHSLKLNMLLERRNAVLKEINELKHNSGVFASHNVGKLAIAEREVKEARDAIHEAERYEGSGRVRKRLVLAAQSRLCEAVESRDQLIEKLAMLHSELSKIWVETHRL